MIIRKDEIEIYGNYFLKDGIGFRRITVLSLDNNTITYAHGHFNKSLIDRLIHTTQSVRSLTAKGRNQTPKVQELSTPLRTGQCGVDDVFKSMLKEGDSDK